MVALVYWVTIKGEDMNESIVNQLSEQDLMRVAAGVIGEMQAMVPWQGSPPGSAAVSGGVHIDEDGFEYKFTEDNYVGFAQVQDECWSKYKNNGFVSTTMKDLVGRLTGYGFDVFSPYEKLNDFMDSTWHDPRNMLTQNFTKYVTRGVVQGELFLTATLHNTGFVEVDFVSPSLISGFDDGSGIICAKNKPMMPLMYKITPVGGGEYYIPDINLAYYPDLWEQLEARPDWGTISTKLMNCGSGLDKFRRCRTFMLQWNQGAVTKRNVGRVKASLIWLNRYDNLKAWEADHKKSSGAYLWSFEFEDLKAFKLWLSLTDSQRAETGLLKPKTPGMSLLLPPGMKMNCHNPKLPSITDQDNDILRMISAGLNTAEDVLTGSSSGTTYSGARLSRGPLADRVKDDIIELERYLIHTFWRGTFFLHCEKTGTSWSFKQKQAYKFENGVPKFKMKTLEGYRTIEISWPQSEMSEVESKSRALMGVKHGPVTEQLGISAKETAKQLGFQNYYKQRLESATEEETFPKLVESAVIESVQAQLGEASQKMPEDNTDDDQKTK